MARTKKPSKKEIERLRDGAQFWNDLDTPDMYMTDPVTGLRPGEEEPPNNSVTVPLDGSLKGVILPTRTKWGQGHWQSEKSGSPGYNIWVVDAEGTPGNYATRYYRLPDSQMYATPKHPADWAGNSYFSTSQSSGYTGKGNVTQSSGMPFGIRFRCPGCGHWYSEHDLAGHAQVCPKEEGETDWAIKCDCPCPSLDMTSKTKPGFPRKPPAVAKKEEQDGDVLQAQQ